MHSCSLALLICLLPLVLSGTHRCPDRHTIYPCTCVEVPLSKRSFSLALTCVGLRDASKLESLIPAISALQPDRLHIYDSFREVEEESRVLPEGWTSSIQAKELLIEDSLLSPCFACNVGPVCGASAITSLRLSNSSWGGGCSRCGNASTSWTGCLQQLQRLQVKRGGLTTLGNDLFPRPLRELLSLDLSRNDIVKVDSNVLKGSPGLEELDLSHNAIQHLSHLFLNWQPPSLRRLDVSWNRIKELGGNVVASFPALRTFSAAHNQLQALVEGEWQNLPKHLRTIHLHGNPIHCDCRLRWLNGTLPVHVEMGGLCGSPQEFAASPLRRASRLLLQRCDAAGRVGTRAPAHAVSTRRAARRQQ